MSRNFKTSFSNNFHVADITIIFGSFKLLSNILSSCVRFELELYHEFARNNRNVSNIAQIEVNNNV